MMNMNFLNDTDTVTEYILTIKDVNDTTMDVLPNKALNCGFVLSLVCISMMSSIHLTEQLTLIHQAFTIRR